MRDLWLYNATLDFDPALAGQVTRRTNVLLSGVRTLAGLAARLWLRVYHRITIVGREHLPSGSFILVANHSSHLDTLCLLSALPISRVPHVFAMAAADYFFGSIPRAILASTFVNAVRFDRRFDCWRSLSACADLLKRHGTVVILFPEGTRSDGFKPRSFKPGVALLAAGQNIPVVPCHLAGTHAALPKGTWFPRPKAVRLAIGEPRHYVHLPPTKESARQICDELRDAVAQLGRAHSHEFDSSARRRKAPEQIVPLIGRIDSIPPLRRTFEASEPIPVTNESSH